MTTAGQGPFPSPERCKRRASRLRYGDQPGAGSPQGILMKESGNEESGFLTRKAACRTTGSEAGRTGVCSRSGPIGAFITTARTVGLKVRIELKAFAADRSVAARVNQHEIDVGGSALPHRAVHVHGGGDIEAFLSRDVRNRGQHRGIGVDDQYPWLNIHLPSPPLSPLPDHFPLGPDLADIPARTAPRQPPERRDVRDILMGSMYVAGSLARSNPTRVPGSSRNRVDPASGPTSLVTRRTPWRRSP